MRKSPYTKREIVRRRWQLAKTEEEKKKWEREYRRLTDEIHKQNLEKRSRKAVRPFIREVQ